MRENSYRTSQLEDWTTEFLDELSENMEMLSTTNWVMLHAMRIATKTKLPNWDDDNVTESEQVFVDYFKKQMKEEGLGKRSHYPQPTWN